MSRRKARFQYAMQGGDGRSQQKYVKEAFVNIQNLNRKVACLPAGPCVTDDDVRYIVSCLKEAIL